MIDLTLIKPRLYGLNFTRLMKSLKTNKYRIARDCGLSWRTLRYWETEAARPSDETALTVATYLGLITKKEISKSELDAQLKALARKIKEI